MKEIMRLIACGICRALGSEKSLAPPVCQDKITAYDLGRLLREYFPDAHYIGFGDADYELMSCEDCKRFLKWYHDKHPYTYDEYDCEVYAWVMRAEALKWMHGKFVFGHIEAAGLDDKYNFPNHGFNFLVNGEHKIFFMDELSVAAPRDDLEPFYEVKPYKLET